MSKGISDDIFPDLTPKPISFDWKSRYNRKQRKNQLFIIKNLTNGKFVKVVNTKDKIRYVDVNKPEEASRWMFRGVEQTMMILLVNSPNLNIEPRMIYKENGKVKIY